MCDDQNRISTRLMYDKCAYDHQMKSQKVDLQTGLVDEQNGIYISHEHIARTLLYRLGVRDDLGDYRTSPIGALL